MNFSLDFPTAWNGPIGRADFRTTNADFIVNEALGFQPSGEGEHIYLRVTKDGVNTQWLAEQLAELAGVEKNDVSYCGLKDRHAVTTQWFSIYAPKSTIDNWQQLENRSDMDVKVLQVTRGNKKLRRGQHLCNEFKITLRNFECDSELLSQLLASVQASGVPNYFGEQRFGRECSNLIRASDWLDEGRKIRSKQQRQMAMSAARAYLFNQVLAARVDNKSWATSLDGEFLESDLPTGPMWGRGRSSASGEALQEEQNALKDWARWMEGLEHCGLKNERRPLVLKPNNLLWHLYGHSLILEFSLPPGQFATALLREIAHLNTIERAVL